MLDKTAVLSRDIEKLREELGKELIKSTDSRLNDKKLIELSKRLDEILVQYIKAANKIGTKK